MSFDWLILLILLATLHDTDIPGPRLYLAIYSKKRALVEIWQMRNGPKVMVVPVGDNARLLTVVRCCVCLSFCIFCPFFVRCQLNLYF